MITLSASGGSVTFTFDGNSTYLNDGQITVPVNSLALIIDESDMATFRKAASNDIFVSANVAEFGMTKAELESWYKANMVGSTGGGTDTGTVQTMIDESISGKANSSDVYTTGQTSGATEIANALSAKLDATAYTPTDLSEYWTSAQTSSAIDEATSGKVDTEDLDISGKTLYKAPSFYENNTTIYTTGNPNKFAMGSTVKSFSNVSFILQFSGATFETITLTLSKANGNITGYTISPSFEYSTVTIQNGKAYVELTNDYYLYSINMAWHGNDFYIQYAKEIESGFTPTVIEGDVYDTLENINDATNETSLKANIMYNEGIWQPKLYMNTNGVTFDYSPFSANTTLHEVLPVDESIDYEYNTNTYGKKMGVYATGNTSTMNVNPSASTYSFFVQSGNEKTRKAKLYLNQSYTGSTDHFINMSYASGNSETNIVKWNWNGNGYTMDDYQSTTAATLTYDADNQVATIEFNDSVKRIMRIYCSKKIAASSNLTDESCRIGLVTIDTNSYKLQDVLDNKVDVSDVTTAVTSGSTNDEIPTAKAVYDYVDTKIAELLNQINNS